MQSLSFQRGSLFLGKYEHYPNLFFSYYLLCLKTFFFPLDTHFYHCCLYIKHENCYRHFKNLVGALQTYIKKKIKVPIIVL